MHEEIIIRILDKAGRFIPFELLKRLRSVLDEELYQYAITPNCTELVVVNDVANRISLYLAFKRFEGLSIKTLQNYERTLLHFSRIVSKNLDQITDMDIRMYLAGKMKSGVKNTTINTIRSTFLSFFNWAEDRGYVSRSPMRTIKVIKTEKVIRKPLTREELEKLRDVCRTLRERAMVEFFYATGCRLDEIQKLALSKINWADGSMVVIGKGNKERVVYLNEKANYYLKKYLESRTDNEDAVFITERKKEKIRHTRLGARMIEQIFASLGKKAGINRPVYPHLLRHTFATHMYDAGADIPVIQALMGHSTMSTTEIYTKVSKRKIKNSHSMYMAG